MAVKRLDWELSKRGLADAARHREKKKEAIRKNIAEIIGDTAIITRRKGQIVKVPIRGLKSYRFIFRRESEGGRGLGQGEGDKGDVIGRQRVREGPPGGAGDQPGLDYLETEVDIDELIDMMLEDLGLPNLKEKKQAETIVPRGWKFEDIEKKGLAAHLDKKRTVKEAIKREAAWVGELMRETGASEEACRKALSAAKGDLLSARSMLVTLDEDKVAAPRGTPIHLFDEDLRYRIPEQDTEVQSHAVVLAMMDVSGSMGTTKKYLARSFFFWLVESLRQIYRTVEIRFIAHTTEAKLVDEETFFHKGESGGTFCHSAYDLAGYLVQTEYPSSKWNVYVFHFSDGEDFEPDRAVSSARRLMMELGVNMMGYAEVQTGPYHFSSLMSTFAGEFQLQREALSQDGFLCVSSKNPSLPFAGVLLKSKEHVYPALREFLKRDRTFH